MKNRTTLIAVISGILCALLLWLYMHSVAQEAEAARAEAIERYGGEQVEVLVATRDIFPGEYLDASNTQSQIWIANMLPEGALQSLDSVSGSTISSSIMKGEVITEKRFATAASHVDVPEGKVALSVPVEEVQAIGGAIEVGSLVDVYATGTSTALLGHNVPILATSSGNTEGANAKITWVTLALDPARVQEYVSAVEQMELYLALPAQTESPQQTPDQAANEQRAQSEQEGSEEKNSQGQQKPQGPQEAKTPEDASDSPESKTT